MVHGVETRHRFMVQKENRSARPDIEINQREKEVGNGDSVLEKDRIAEEAHS